MARSADEGVSFHFREVQRVETAVDTLYKLCTDERLNHSVEVMSGLRAKECSAMLSAFFHAVAEEDLCLILTFDYEQPDDQTIISFLRGGE